MRIRLGQMFAPTAVRMALVAFILSFSNLVLGVVVMWPLLPEAPIWAKMFFGLSMFGFATAIILSIYWICKGSDDPTTKRIEEMHQILTTQNKYTKVEAFIVLLEGLREFIEKRSPQK